MVYWCNTGLAGQPNLNLYNVYMIYRFIADDLVNSGFNIYRMLLP